MNVNSFAIKVYGVVCGATQLAAARFAKLTDLLASALPVETAPGRARVGFVIQHQGLTADYVVLAWWDNENELPLRVWVRAGEEWREAVLGESVCVWDLEVMWYERNLWIATALSGRDLSTVLPEYLSAHYQQS